MQVYCEEWSRPLVGLRVMQRPSLREEEDEEERRMGRTGRVPIYKGRCEQAGAKIKETQ